MAGLVQVTLHSVTRRFPSKTVVKDAARLVSTSLVRNGQQKYQYQTPLSRVKKNLKDAAATATVAGKRIDSVAASLASKGFLRSRNSYEPPQDVTARIEQIFASMKIPTDASFAQRPLQEKFTVLRACSDCFNHSIPNSQIHEIQTFGNIVEFYETPVDTKTPLDTLQRAQLPENLHIQYNYVRFHPDTDSMFGGKSAFPKSSTLVTGLKYRKKYEGHIAKRSWP